MKIGLYGGIANNIYVFAKALSSEGVDVRFIRDRSDHYPFSQPVWEDMSFCLPYDEIPIAADWSWEAWERFERKIGWKAPTWLCDPLDHLEKHRPPPSVPGQPLDRYWLRRYLSAPHRAATLQEMSECDALLVCGTEGSILARLSGKPYVIWPHGGDMMVAAGLLCPDWLQIRKRVAYHIVRKQLASSFANALCIGNHEPTGICTDYGGAERYIRTLNVVFMPIPIPVRPRLPASPRREALVTLLGELGLPPVDDHDIIGFVPSRLDYQWKGQDRLLKALVHLKARGTHLPIRLIFAGWGVDFRMARQFAFENGISDHVIFLGSALSKPLLFRFYAASDFVVDQFVLGMYGTAALEAMACGAPLLTWLNQSYDRPWGAPPVIQAQSVAEITDALKQIAQGSIDLDACGLKLQEWMNRIHNPRTVVIDLMERFSRASVGKITV